MKQIEDLKTEEIEFLLPLDISKVEKIKRYCPFCPLKDKEDTVHYKQKFYRFDDCYSGQHHRLYEIGYKRGPNEYLYRTDRHYSFRGALIEMYKILKDAGDLPEAKE